MPISDTIRVEKPPNFGGDDFLLRAVVVVNPEEHGANIPKLFVDGDNANVRGVTLDSRGRWTALEVIRDVDGSQAADPDGFVYYSVEEFGAVRAQGAVFNDDLSGIYLETTVANIGTPMRAYLFNDAGGGPNVISHFQGEFYHEVEYWARYREGAPPHGSTVCWGVKAMLGRYQAARIYTIDLMHMTGSADRLDNPYGIQAANDGRMLFDSITLNGLPPGWVVVSSSPRQHENLGASPPELVKPLGGTQHQIMVLGQGMFRRYAICPAANASKAVDMLELYGHGQCIGQNSYYKTRGFGCGRFRVPEIVAPASLSAHRAGFASALGSHTSPSGGSLRNDYANGTDNHINMDNPAAGWYHPRHQGGGGTGGNGIDQSRCAHHHREGWLYDLELAQATLDRSRVWVYDVRTGEPITQEDMIAINNNSWPGAPGHAVQGKTPWDSQVDGNTVVPWTQRSQFIPTDRPWNQPSPGWTIPHETYTGERGYHDGNHSVRAWNELLLPMFGINHQGARMVMKFMANFYRLSVNPYGVAGINFSFPLWLGLTDIPDANQQLTSAGWDGQGWLQYHRSVGWRLNLLSWMYQFEHDPVRRLVEYVRIEEAVKVVLRNASSVGMGIRATPQGGISGLADPWDEGIFGATDTGTNTGAFPDGRDWYGCWESPPSPPPPPPLTCTPNAETSVDVNQSKYQVFKALGLYGCAESALKGINQSLYSDVVNRISELCRFRHETMHPTAASDVPGNFIQAWLTGTSTPITTGIRWPLPGWLDDADTTPTTAVLAYLITGSLEPLDKALQTRGLYDSGAGPGNQDYETFVTNMMGGTGQMDETGWVTAEIQNLPAGGVSMALGTWGMTLAAELTVPARAPFFTLRYELFMVPSTDPGGGTVNPTASLALAEFGLAATPTVVTGARLTTDMGRYTFALTATVGGVPGEAGLPGSRASARPSITGRARATPGVLVVSGAKAP